MASHAASQSSRSRIWTVTERPVTSSLHAGWPLAQTGCHPTVASGSHAGADEHEDVDATSISSAGVERTTSG